MCDLRIKCRTLTVSPLSQMNLIMGSELFHIHGLPWNWANPMQMCSNRKTPQVVSFPVG